MNYTTIVVKGQVRIEAGDTFKGCQVVEAACGNALIKLDQAKNALRCAYNAAGGVLELNTSDRQSATGDGLIQEFMGFRLVVDKELQGEEIRANDNSGIIYVSELTIDKIKEVRRQLAKSHKKERDFDRPVNPPKRF